MCEAVLLPDLHAAADSTPPIIPLAEDESAGVLAPDIRRAWRNVGTSDSTPTSIPLSEDDIAGSLAPGVHRACRSAGGSGNGWEGGASSSGHAGADAAGSGSEHGVKQLAPSGRVKQLAGADAAGNGSQHAEVGARKGGGQDPERKGGGQDAVGHGGERGNGEGVPCTLHTKTSTLNP